MKSKARLFITLLGLAAALPCQAVVINIPDYSLAPDGEGSFRPDTKKALETRAFDGI